VTALEAAPGTVTPDSPFPGLAHYTGEYAELFFGRESETQQIIGNLQVARLTLLYAQSGVGKSSLLSAGVAPRLRALAQATLTEEGAPEYIPVEFPLELGDGRRLSWSGDAVAHLIEATNAAVRPFSASGADADTTLEQALAQASERTGATMLVILDQFEELFNYESGNGTGTSFAHQFATCLNRPDLRAHFLIAIREDAYARVGDLLSSRVSNVYGNYMHLEYLDATALRESVARSLAAFNRLYAPEDPYGLEPGLLDAILEEVSDVSRSQNGLASDAKTAGIDTAFLQLIMRRLWDEEVAEGSRVLHRQTLARLGGASAIIRTHLDTAMANFAPAEQDTAAAAFRYLVTPDRAKIALGPRALSEWTGVPEPRLAAVLDALAGTNMKILRPIAQADRAEDRRYEIFHDGLAEPIISWRQQHDDAERRELQQQAARERRRRKLAAAAAAVFFVALVAVAVAFLLVVLNREQAKKNLAASVAISERINDVQGPFFGPAAAALAGLEAYRLSPTFEARQQIFGVLEDNAGLPTVAAGHTRSVNAVTFLANSPVVASAGSDGTIRLWNRDGQALLPHPLASYTSDAVLSLAASSRGILAAGRTGVVDLWKVSDPAHPKPLPALRVGGGTENTLAFSPQGGLLVVGNDAGKLTFWNLANPAKPTRVSQMNVGSPVQDIAVDAHGSRVAVADDKDVRIYVIGGSWSSTRTGGLAVAWSPDGALAWAVDDTKDPRIAYMPAGRTSPSKYFRTTDLANSLAFADHGKVLVAGGDDWNVTTWDVASGRPFGPPRVQSAYNDVLGVAVSGDGSTIAAGGYDAKVKIWPLRAERPLASIVGGLAPNELTTTKDGTGPYIDSIALGPRDQVATAGRAAGVLIWELHASGVPRPVTRTPPSQHWRDAVAWSGNVLAASDGHRIVLWNTAPSCERSAVLACRLGDSGGAFHTQDVRALAFDSSGKVLASGGYDGRVNLWGVGSKGGLLHLATVVDEGQTINAIAFSANGKLLAVAGEDGTLRLWNVGDPNKPMPAGESRWAHSGVAVTAVAFSPVEVNGDLLLASSGADQQVDLWEVDPTRGLRSSDSQKLSQTNTILALAFTPDGKVLAAGDGDGATCLWDVATRRTLGGGDCLLGYGTDNTRLTGIFALAFTPDGTTLLSAGEGNPLVAWSSLFWSGDRTALQDAVCRFAGAEGLRTLTSDERRIAFLQTPLASRSAKPTCP
jgi:WD40 repeat protein